MRKFIPDQHHIDISALAPNTGLANRARLLAGAEYFVGLSHLDGIFWGEMKGSEGHLHKVVFQPEPTTLRCSCSFFPKPCHHALALAHIWAESGENAFLPTETQPEWVSFLLSGQSGTLPSAKNTAEQKIAARQKTYLERIERTAAGFEDLETWLSDAVRRGLATLVGENPQFYADIAARMADSSMTGTSRLLRLLKDVSTARPDWADETLQLFGELYLAVQAFKRRESLPEGLVSDLQAYIGLNAKKEDALQSGDTVQDIWAVAGTRESKVEDRLNARLTWLYGAKSMRFALILEYAFGGQEFLPGLPIWGIFKGEVAFYPSALPLRALLKNEPVFVPKRVEKLSGYANFEALSQAYSKALGQQPWLRYWPAVLENVHIFVDKSRFDLRDEAGYSLPLALYEDGGWQMLAVSGGKAVTVFGEWNGQVFLPITVLCEGHLMGMPGHKISRLAQQNEE